MNPHKSVIKLLIKEMISIHLIFKSTIGFMGRDICFTESTIYLKLDRREKCVKNV